MHRLFLGLIAAAALGMMGLLVAAFVWPEGAWVGGAREDSLNLGPAEALPVGEPQWVQEDLGFTDSRWNVTPVIDTPGRSRDVRLAVVRHADDSISVFTTRDPRNACPLTWRTDLQFALGGFFRDPCHGSAYDERGAWVFGPSPRGMDYLDAEINERGEVIVDLRRLHKGEPVQQRPQADDPPAPAGTPWPTITPTSAR